MLKSLVFLFLFTSIASAALTETQQRAAAREELEKMSAALMKGDIDRFIAYINPVFVEVMGGKEKLSKQLKASSKEVIAAIKSSTVGQASKIFKVKNELQCILRDTVKSAYAVGPGYMLENVIAISDDGGTHWTFINAGDSFDFYKQYKPYLPKLARELEKMLVERLKENQAKS